jgi:hypothetical protein
MGYPTGKKLHTGTGMGKNLNPHAGMGFLAGRVRVSRCGYGIALPDRFLPIAISNPVEHSHLQILLDSEAADDERHCTDSVVTGLPGLSLELLKRPRSSTM